MISLATGMWTLARVAEVIERRAPGRRERRQSRGDHRDLRPDPGAPIQIRKAAARNG